MRHSRRGRFHERINAQWPAGPCYYPPKQASPGEPARGWLESQCGWCSFSRSRKWSRLMNSKTAPRLQCCAASPDRVRLHRITCDPPDHVRLRRITCDSAQSRVSARGPIISWAGTVPDLDPGEGRQHNPEARLWTTQPYIRLAWIAATLSGEYRSLPETSEVRRPYTIEIGLLKIQPRCPSL